MKRRHIPCWKNALGIGLGAATGVGFATWETEESEEGDVPFSEEELVEMVMHAAERAIEAREQIPPEEDGGAIDRWHVIYGAAAELAEMYEEYHRGAS